MMDEDEDEDDDDGDDDDDGLFDGAVMMWLLVSKMLLFNHGNGMMIPTEFPQMFQNGSTTSW
jgi:hypothetical protein